VFLLLKGETEGRFDVLFYKPSKSLDIVTKSKYPKKELSEIAELQRGRFSHRPRNDPKFYGGNYPFIQTGDVVRASREGGDIQYSQTLNELGLSVSKIFESNILVITIAANIGDTAILSYPACFPDSLVTIKPKTEELDIRYLDIFFKFIKQYLNEIAPQSAQKNINLQQLSPVPIVIPPLETQQTIINIFEQAYVTKKANEAQAQALLASIDEYLLKELGITLPDKQENSLKNRVFLRNISEVGGGRFDGYYYGEFFERFHTALAEGNYPISQLESLCSKITDGTHYTPTYVQEGVKFISVKNVRRSKISFDDVKFITEEEHLTLTKRAKPEPNDILLTKIGTIGLACVIEEGLPEFSIFVSLALLKPTDTINSYFLSEVINSPIVTNQFERDLKGTGVPDLHLENIRKVSIPLPPLEIQEKIVVEIQRIREQAQTLQNEAKAVLEQAKIKVEKMILEGGNDD
jgi:restriction endonuclease S subunit